MATKSKLTRIEKRKRLDALFDRGGYVRFGIKDGAPVVNPETESDEDVRVWVGPPSPYQREMAIRDAQGIRARTVIEAKSKEDSNQWVTIRAFVAALSNEALADYLIELDDTDHIAQARRDTLLEKEWESFNELRDAMRKYEDAGSPVGDPEWEPLLEKNRRFADQVLARAEELEKDARDSFKLMPRNKLEEKAIEKRIEQAASAAFMGAYEEQMLFYSCRDDEDHKVLYFDDVTDMKSQHADIQNALRARLAETISEATEAKNSQGVAPGSTSSVLPDAPETSESSTPEE